MPPAEGGGMEINMSELHLSDVKPGMKLEQAVVLPDGKTLLSTGTILVLKILINYMSMV